METIIHDDRVEAPPPDLELEQADADVLEARKQPIQDGIKRMASDLLDKLTPICSESGKSSQTWWPDWRRKRDTLRMELLREVKPQLNQLGPQPRAQRPNRLKGLCMLPSMSGGLSQRSLFSPGEWNSA